MRSVIVTLLALLAAASRAAAEPARLAVGNETGRWSSFLPFMAEEAIKRYQEHRECHRERAGRRAVRFEADQGPANPWNASVGGSVALSRHWELFAEDGFNFDDVRLFATGLTFRF